MKFSNLLTPFLWMLALNAQADQPASEMLPGTWINVRMEHVADGALVRVQEPRGTVQIVYTKNGTWEFMSPQNHNSGRYSWLNEKSIEAVIEKSDIESQVGWRSVKHIEVGKQSLKILTAFDEQAIAKLKPRSDGSRPKSMSVISVFERAPARSK
ncbi:hypothetical protein [Massilia sp. BJB1822]|uniref:hypothetical protein n=1 Tax=Massilia sp. BJB1822 TaxID=2744470 RepID=UPI00159309D9|nr:hypothetical protein [Massilia sp. BJB1822]NVD97581.1 hypothetical protein [Massilia sp. BJB1822]